MLKYGIAQPYLAIFNEEGKPVMNPITGIPLGAYITNFSYKYDEEKENQASITFDVGDPDTVDIEDLQEKKIVVLQWGYIYSDTTFISSEPKIIQVKDFNCTFNSTGTHVTIKFIDSVSSVRKLPPHRPSAEDDDDDGYSSLVEYMERGCDQGLGIIIEKFEH
jgi:hypothetical protein